MSKLNIVYDPINGVTVPDGRIDAFVDELLEHSKQESFCGTYCIGSKLVIGRFLQLVGCDVISLEDIVFWKDGVVIPYNGGLSDPFNVSGHKGYNHPWGKDPYRC